jgi:hypothetical protein
MSSCRGNWVRGLIPTLSYMIAALSPPGYIQCEGRIDCRHVWYRRGGTSIGENRSSRWLESQSRIDK